MHIYVKPRIFMAYTFFLLLLFENILTYRVASVFQYSDEIIEIACFIFIIVCIAKRFPFPRRLIKIMFLYTLVMCVLSISTLVNSLQPTIAEIRDVISFLKYPVCFVGTFCYLEKKRIKLPNPSKLIEIIIIVLLVFFIFDLFLNISGSNQYALGGMLHSCRLGFVHETFMVASVVILFACAQAFINKNRIVYTSICLIFIIFSFKAKAYLFLAVYYAFLYFNSPRFSKKVFALFVLGVGLFFFVGDKFVFYWSGAEGITARRAITITSFIVAKDFLPLGVGFGNYGSYVAHTYYPEYYRRYHLYDVWGLRNQNVWSNSDHFWPTIIGEGGYICFVLFLLYLKAVYDFIKEKTSQNGFKIAIIPFLYLLCASVAESAFFNTYGAIYGIITAVLVYHFKVKRESSREK